VNWTALLISLASAAGAAAAGVVLRSLRQDVQALLDSSHGHAAPAEHEGQLVAGAPTVPGTPGDVVTATVTPVQE